MLKNVIRILEKENWIRYLNDNYHWKNTNRYVDIDLVDNRPRYIDIYAYADEEKYGSYLTAHEFQLFYELITALDNLGWESKIE